MRDFTVYLLASKKEEREKNNEFHYYYFFLLPFKYFIIFLTDFLYIWGKKKKKGDKFCIFIIIMMITDYARFQVYIFLPIFKAMKAKNGEKLL